jgi:TonB-dependent starch-binding outer membrane protein SusC
MKRVVKLVTAALAVLLFPAGLTAQSVGSVTGQVTDQTTQRPVQAVQILVTGMQRGAQTDENGRYTIVGVPAGTHTIQARRVGYSPRSQTVTVTSGGTATVNFALNASVAILQEVTVNAVTGQAQRREEVGVNTGNIDVANLNQGPITKMADVLQGRVAGVNLSNTTGTAGGSQRIRIRGSNSLSLSNEPLLYVDGVQTSNAKGGINLGGQDYSRLNDLNPEEIENIEILKGPAASAIYGSAAANGVILITTRKGRAGSAKWNVYGEGGWSNDKANYPLNFAALSVFDASQPYYDIDEGGILNTVQVFGAGAPYNICPNYQAGIPAGTTLNGLTRCSQDVVLSFDQFRDARTTPYQTGTRNKYGANVAGGSNSLTYFLSGDKELEQGVLRPNDVARTSLRANMNAQIGNNANIGINSAFVSSRTKRISNDNSIFSPLINGLLGPAQYIPGMESDTVNGPSTRLGSWFGYNTGDQRKVNADQGVDRFIVGSNANYTPYGWLRLNANAGLDIYARTDAQTVNPADKLPLAQSYILGNHYAFRGNSHQWTSNASGTGTFNLRDNVVSNTTVGGSYQRNLFEGNDCSGIGIPAGTESCSATTSQFAITESHTDERTLGLFAREELALNERLFVAASLRADNNSGLSRDISGLAYYPSANVSWLISRESFFPDLSFVNQLRLRGGWGQAGQRPGFGAGDTFFQPRVTQVAGQEIPALILTNTGNPNLKVERTTEVEGGFDAGFLNDRATVEFTAYRRRSKDALVSRQLPPSAGLTGTVFQNLGSIRNSGLELGLGVNVLNRNNLKLDTRLTATTLSNKIESLGAGIAPISLYRGEQAHREGFPAGAYFALPLKYNDANGDGKLTRAEVSVDTSQFLIVPHQCVATATVSCITGQLDTLKTAYVGPSSPTNTQSIFADLTLFNMFTISTLFERRAGMRQLNETEFFRCRQQAGTAFYSQCGALSNPNASLESQAAFIGAQFISATPYGYIEDGRFVKWRELSVRFNVPESLGSRTRLLNGAAISLSGRNLHTWTKYSGLDPEIAETGGAGNFNQGEFNTQPPVRTFTVRFDFKP